MIFLILPTSPPVKSIDIVRGKKLLLILDTFFFSFSSALLYLNGDFKGGEFLFANPDDSIQVKLNAEKQFPEVIKM